MPASRNRRSRCRRRHLGGALIAFAAALTVPAAASATVDVVADNARTTVTVTARSVSGPDGDHGLHLGFTAFPGGGLRAAQLRFGNPSIGTPGAPCSRDILANLVDCDFLPRQVVLDFGDGADDVRATTAGSSCVAGPRDAPDRPRVSITGSLGDGRDRLSLPTGGLINDDDCTAGARTEAPVFDVVSVDGGAGPDTFEGASDVDRTPRIATWSGGTGSDRFIDGVGPEIFIGAPNLDTVSYLRHTGPLLLSPGQTAFGDGPDGDTSGATSRW